MVIAERWERQAEQLGSALHLTNRDIVLELFVTATRKAIAGTLTESDARELLDSILHAAGHEGLHSETVQEFATHWLAARKFEVSTSTFVIYERALRIFLAYLGSAAMQPLHSVTTRQIEVFRDTRVMEGYCVTTIDRDLQVVRSMFRAAQSQKYLRLDPAEAVKLLARQRKTRWQKVTRAVFTVAELDTLLNMAQGEWQTIILLGRYTGARLGDCARMRWHHVRLDTGVIQYADEKSGKQHTVPIHRRLRDHLLALHRRDDSDGLLCPALAERVTSGCNGLSIQFRKLMRRSGLDRLEVKAGSEPGQQQRKRKFARRSFHSLRHSYNSELANAHVPQEIRRRLIGHASDSLNNVYTHLDLSVFRSAIDKLS